MLLTRAAKRLANTAVISLSSDGEIAPVEEPVLKVVQLSAEDDAKYAAVLSFCDRLHQLKNEKRAEFERVGIDFVFNGLSRQQPRNATRDALHLLWFMLGTALTRANNTCRRIIRDIDNETARAIVCDRSQLRELRDELACVMQNDGGHDKDARVSRLEHLITGKQKMILAEGRKVELLYGLLGPKQRTYSRRGKSTQSKRSRVGAQVQTLVGPFLWD